MVTQLYTNKLTSRPSFTDLVSLQRFFLDKRGRRKPFSTRCHMALCWLSSTRLSDLTSVLPCSASCPRTLISTKCVLRVPCPLVSAEFSQGEALAVDLRERGRSELFTAYLAMALAVAEFLRPHGSCRVAPLPQPQPSLGCGYTGPSSCLFRLRGAKSFPQDLALGALPYSTQ